MQKVYSKEGTEDGPRTKVTIISDELSLDIGKEPEGWAITPLVSLEVSTHMKYMYSFKKKQNLHYRALSL